MAAVRIISTVSGKGGVGKTVLSANLARIVAFSRKVLLIDFDFPNQGLTGLFADEVPPSCFSVHDMIWGPELPQANQVFAVRQNLFFMPAFNPAARDRFDVRLDQLSKLELGTRIAAQLRLLIEALDVDFVMLDCHGGLDSFSFVSFSLSDRVLIVSEPDRITFNGTLELIDYYEKNWVDALSNTAEGQTPPPAKALFLLNRVSGRYSYSGLLQIYKKGVGDNSSFASQIIAKYVFIPADSILARSISEYPFYIELAPESIFCQKLELIYLDLFGTQPEVRGRRPTYYIFERHRRRSLERLLTSVEEQRTRAVFSFVTMVQFVMLVALFLLGSLSLMPGPSADRQAPVDILMEYPRAVPALGLVLAIALVGVAWANLAISKYYRDSGRFEFRLFKLGRRRIAMITVLRLVQAISARLYLLVSAFLFALAALFGLIGFLETLIHK